MPEKTDTQRRDIFGRLLYVSEFTVQGGTVKLEWPYPLSKDDCDDVLSWLDLTSRVIRRMSAAAMQQEGKVMPSDYDKPQCYTTTTDRFTAAALLPEPPSTQDTHATPAKEGQ